MNIFLFLIGRKVNDLGRDLAFGDTAIRVSMKPYSFMRP